MKSEYRNICDVIVKNDICIGCGLCAGVCPTKVLRMDFNALGEYQPEEFKAGCLPTCNLCLDVCPFWDRNKNEDELGEELFGQQDNIQHQPETGYYLQGFVGYSNKDGQREQGASGGMTTWMLESLLNQQIVDKVVCVGSKPDPNQLYNFRVCSTVEEIRAASRSCYYPVELSGVIRYILENDGRYAVTGLPCYIKGLRLVMNRFPKLKRRIVLLCGLVCAQTQSKGFAEALCKLRGGDPSHMEKAIFRVKDDSRPANDYGFQFSCSEGEVREGSVFFKEGLGELWLNGFFTPNACHYCDDLFAETADITFMDAWLPQYQQDPKGHNLVLVRTKAALDILCNGMKAEELTLKPIPVKEIIRSQTGGVKRKRKILALRMLRDEASQGFEYRPRKRAVSPDGLEVEEKLLFLLRERMREEYRSRYQQDHSFSPYSWRFAMVRLMIVGISKASPLFRLSRKMFGPFKKMLHPSGQ